MMGAKWLKRKGKAAVEGWTLRAARAQDLEAASRLVGVCDLPSAGIEAQFGERYVVAERDGELLGMAGVEMHGRHGLLRSVGVVPWVRGSGLGAAMVRDRVAWARAHGIESLYLLTMTADRYFARHGFVAVDRGAAPAEIQAAREFSETCPTTAVLMVYAAERGTGLGKPGLVGSAPLAKDGGCCGSGGRTAAAGLDAAGADEVRGVVRDYYARAAREARAGQDACCGGSCGAENPITSDLYGSHELAGLPEDAVRASLGCGNPALLAELREGETVLDLGSGGGIDVLLSARRVGPKGRAYGLDMTDEMLELARENQRKAGVTNVEFLKGEIEAMPLPDASVDVIISNCVINLSADKRRVLAEAFRVLKPGGRLAVSDIVVRREIPREIRRNAELWAGCVAGALEEWTYRKLLREAGFQDIEVVPTRVYSAEDAGVIGADVALDDAAMRALDGAFMSAFVRASKPVV
jgi:N-acetylglutamate synthase-like GNAT family acetyltransferase/SAM-dependent methyltransferase